MKKTGQVIPFCLYHRIDAATNTYLGFISSPRKTLMEDGTENYGCAPEPKTYRQWIFAGMFYGMMPNFRPIPVGMKLFCAQRSGSYPYDTADVTLTYDPFNIKNDCVYFMTFSQPVPNTVPLYFHKLGLHVFPSFDKFPPSDDTAWEQTDISPVFVMTKETVGDIFNPSYKNTLKFKCVNGRCIPWVKNISDLYDSDPHKDLMVLDDCVLFCNDLSISNTNGKPANILEQVSIINTRNPFFPFISNFMIIVIIFLFSTLFFYIVTDRIKNTNKKK